ncbi:MAG: putative sporulation protein YtxC [Thermotaleaceae bacterium]
MNLLTVILKDNSSYIEERLEKEIGGFEKEGILIRKNIEQQDKGRIINYDLVESTLSAYSKDDFENIFKHYMANAFSDIIVHDLESKLIKKMLSDHYYYFTNQEKESILEHVDSVLDSEEIRYHEGITYKISRKAKILHHLIDYLKEHEQLHLDGFIRFRLKAYLHELEEGIDKAVEEFLMEKEYDEFIRLLRYFVDIQEAKVDMVNVLIDEKGKYVLYDSLNRMINSEYLEDIATEMADKDISYDDLLISSLITLAPNKIHIHFTGEIKNKEIIETIKNVFSNRVYICNGCSLCSVIKSAKKE